MKRRVRTDTETAVQNAVEEDEPVLIEAPPASGKTYNAVRVAQKEGLKVTYLAARRDLYAQAEEEAKEIDDTLEYTTIPAPHRDCPTFRGDKGETGRAQKLYNKGQFGREIHYSDTANTPCQTPHSDCPYIQKLERIESEADTFDLLIGNHQHAYKEDYLENRVVIFDEFNPSPFVEWFPTQSDISDSPGEIIGNFLESVEEIPYNDLTDIVEARSLADESDEVNLEWEWFRKNGARRQAVQDQIDLTPSSHDGAHLYAGLLTLGLMFADKIGRGIEVAHDPDRWKKANINTGIRYMRDRNTRKTAILRPPSELQAASQIIGMDALPTETLWNTVFDCSFTLKKVIERERLSKYLEDGLGFEVIQLANRSNHYSSGNIYKNDMYRFEAARIREDSDFPVISRKKALDRYRVKSWYKKCVKSHPDDSSDDDFFDKNYAKVKSSNDFAEEPIGFVSGSPFPGDHIIKYWCGLCGESTEPIREGQGLQGFSGFGQDIYEHFTHHEVFQAILRFGRDLSDGADVTVYINTTAIPGWLSDIVTELDLKTPDSSEKCFKILDQFIQSTRGENSELDISSFKDYLENSVNMGVSEQYVRDVITDKELEPYIDKREDTGRGGADLYKWAGDDSIETCVCPDSPVEIGLPTTSSVYFLPSSSKPRNSDQ